MRVISIAGLLLVLAAGAVLILVQALFSASAAVIAVQAAAIALMVWARLTLGRRSLHAAADPTEGEFVQTGPYRFIRHPIYAAACLFCWAGILANTRAASVAGGIMLLAGSAIRMAAEERLLVKHYPGYGAYMKKTKRMIPFVF